MTFDLKADGFYIDGAMVSPAGDDTFSLENPDTGEVYAQVPRPTNADVDRAVAAARRSFDEGVWRRVPVQERAELLTQAMAKIDAQTDDLSRTITYENGTPVQTSQVFISGLVKLTDVLCRMAPLVPDTDRRVGLWEYELQREPMGVVASLVPWNGPFGSVALEAVQALLAGCSIVSKPPPEAPFAVLEWARALEEVGVPAGVFNLLPADGPVSEYLVSHPGVDLVTFVGGVSVGRKVAEACGRNLKRVVLELGGKSAAVVLDDADLQIAADSVAAGAYNNSGQICSALTRVIVPRAAVDEVADRLRVKAESKVIGHPLDPATTMGPMATRTHFDNVRRCLEAGRSEGATVVFGGGVPDGFGGGFYLEPTLFIGDNDMSISRDEIFGPVVTLIPHDGEDDAVRIANDTEYGLGGAVFSTDEDRALGVASRLQTGSVTINGYISNLLAPRDPYKTSGIGTTWGFAGYQALRAKRVVNLRPAATPVDPSALVVGDRD